MDPGAEGRPGGRPGVHLVPAVAGSVARRDRRVVHPGDADGRASIADAYTLFHERNGDAVQNNPEKFDFDGSGSIETDDAVALFQSL